MGHGPPSWHATPSRGGTAELLISELLGLAPVAVLAQNLFCASLFLPPLLPSRLAFPMQVRLLTALRAQIAQGGDFKGRGKGTDTEDLS